MKFWPSKPVILPKFLVMQIWLSFPSAERSTRWACSAAGRSKLLIIRETENLTVLLARHQYQVLQWRLLGQCWLASITYLVEFLCNIALKRCFLMLQCHTVKITSLPPIHLPMHLPLPYFSSLVIGRFQVKLLWVFSTDKTDTQAFPGTSSRINLCQ